MPRTGDTTVQQLFQLVYSLQSGVDPEESVVT